MPAAFTVAPDGRIFYGELRTGEIRIFNPRDSSNQSFFVFSDVVATKGGGGVIGLALHPNFPQEPSVYATVTRRVSGEIRMQIVRISDDPLEATGLARQTVGTRADLEVIFDAGVVSETDPVGGRLLFGPDRMLYVSVGDKDRFVNAQDARTPEGKILRMDAAGKIRPDNPSSASNTFAYGLRNSLGFAFDPETKAMWLTDQGGTCNDELNRVLRGRNYGWGPSRTCRTPPAAPRNTNQNGPSPVLPNLFYTSSEDLTGVAFCSACGLGEDDEGRLFFGAYKTGLIRRVTLNSDRTAVSSQSVAYDHPTNVLSMERGPNGTLYFSDRTAIYKLETSETIPARVSASATRSISAIASRMFSSPAITARPIAKGLATPAGFAFAPDGRIFYGELVGGAIRILRPETSTNKLFFVIPGAKGQLGLFGVALHPKYPASPFVYAYVTRLVADQPRNQIVRITDSDGKGSAMEVIFDGGAADGTHRGGRLRFGPDGMLYLVIGDRGVPGEAQNLRSASGKILRIAPDGRVPPDNPFPDSHVFAYGFRNSFGFAFDPVTDRLWETENGPRCNDELNLVLPGRNYGWGEQSRGCKARPAPPRNTNQEGPRPVLPKRFYSPTIAPTGAVFCMRCGLGPQSERRLFWGAWKTGEIRRVTLNGSRTGVASEQIAYKHPRWVMSMERAPDGAIYFSDPGAIYKLGWR